MIVLKKTHTDLQTRYQNEIVERCALQAQVDTLTTRLDAVGTERAALQVSLDSALAGRTHQDARITTLEATLANYRQALEDTALLITTQRNKAAFAEKHAALLALTEQTQDAHTTP